MEVTTLLLFVVVTAASMLLFFRDPRRARMVRLIEKLPGPFAFPMFGTALPFILASRNKRMKLLEDRVNQYQPIYRAWIGSTPTINITRPEHAEAVLNSIRHLDKPFAYKFLRPWLGTGLLTSSGQKWHTHRKMITPTFHFKILDNFVEVFSEKSKILVTKLQKEVGSQGFDVYPYITRCALDIICETAMGTPVYAQEDLDSPYVSAIYDLSEVTIFRMIRPWLHPDFLFRLSSAGKKYNERLTLLHSFTNKVIKEKKSLYATKSQRTEDKGVSEDDEIGRKERVAFLDMLLDVSEGGRKLTDEEIREEVDTFMFEGHDTTSAGMCWALYMLGLHPDVQEKAYQEQKSIFQGSDRSPTMKDLNEMKYLERVIKETLRLYPSVPGIGRVLNEDVKMGEFIVPAGSTVHLHIYFLHRNPDQFPDPEKFDPDNFLPERTSKRHSYAYIPFSAGPRNCIGQKFALLEEKTVLSYILRHYKLRSLDKREDVALLSELVLRPENGVRLGLSLRNVGMK
ncbi:cytochrome P450 4C1-like isoform X2 [Zootermopsis nevadensis]|uniref:Cytochrome P450 4C1 n=1 Tax=Zootermopsis nevadensis TaxID=136037 RepID=A0A067R367_ZOONE|nr:cytochrome P450 4C1-like isoform X2 [Zootermopsis nevadensis]KDR12227.1 Cytochrome P450 4C1 [Zootermopsis nevadensis]